MRANIAYCGLDCEQCDAYIATLHDDQALRGKDRQALGGAEPRAHFARTHQLSRLPRGRGQDRVLRTALRCAPMRPQKRHGYLWRLPGDGHMPDGRGDLRKRPRRPEKPAGLGKARPMPPAACQTARLRRRVSAHHIVLPASRAVQTHGPPASPAHFPEKAHPLCAQAYAPRGCRPCRRGMRDVFSTLAPPVPSKQTHPPMHAKPHARP